jgi:hypothetical protein
MVKLKSKRDLSHYGLILSPFADEFKRGLTILREQSVGLLEIRFLI